MIPSRSLSLVEIISETFSIYGRTFARYGLLFVVLIVPGMCLVTAGTTGLTEDIIASARHDLTVSDTDLTNARNDFNAFISQQNPTLWKEFPGAGEPYPHANTQRLIPFVTGNVNRFSGSFDLLGGGLLLLMVGFFALISITIDLASQVFEERRQELFGSLRAAFAKHVWKILFLYLLYWVVMLSFDGLIGLLPDAAAGALSGFTLVAQIYLILRLYVTVPALVSEESGPFQAVTRSWQLTKNATGRILGTALVFSVILFVAFMMLLVVVQFFFSDFSLWLNDILTRDHLTIQWLLESTPGAIREAAGEMTVALLILFGVTPIFSTVLYYDLRTRRDGPLMYVDENP